MTVRVVGAGLGRTGTTSLKAALERLLGGPCYHMIETFTRPDDRAVWTRAFRGEPVDWPAFFEGYEATVDWPGAGVWEDIHTAFPDALVLLSVRSPESWWRSASSTIFGSLDPSRPEGAGQPRDGMAEAMMARFTPDFLDEEAAVAAFLAHNQHVRDTVPPDRLLEWTASDGWAPLCAALDLPVPDEPFPHANTTAEFRSRAGFDA